MCKLDGHLSRKGLSSRPAQALGGIIRSSQTARKRQLGTAQKTEAAAAAAVRSSTSIMPPPGMDVTRTLP